MVLLVIPIIVIFSTDKGLESIFAYPPGWFLKFSFANVGFPGSQCSRSPVYANSETNIIFDC